MLKFFPWSCYCCYKLNPHWPGEVYLHDFHNLLIELIEQGDNLVVNWRGKALAVLYDDLLELLIPFISLTDSKLCLISVLFQSIDLIEQSASFCSGLLELLLELANVDCRIRSGRLLLFIVALADSC